MPGRRASQERWYELDAWVERPGGSRERFELRVSRPEKHPAFGWQVTVDCPEIHPDPLPVYGPDQRAIWDQAANFIREALRDEGVRVVDRDGNPIELPKPDWKKWGLDDLEP